ncbi:hypothetical protein M0R45_009235 [Rubus argutus]|uniref:Uncharacterized protein n=1 Tax=Rubus argutus TaxID=59490 RepID=A0AAW1Y499_RUBAR
MMAMAMYDVLSNPTSVELLSILVWEHIVGLPPDLLMHMAALFVGETLRMVVNLDRVGPLLCLANTQGRRITCALLFAVPGVSAESLNFQASLLRKPLFGSTCTPLVAPLLLVVSFSEAIAPLWLLGMTVGKHSRVLDPFFELALMDTTPDLALPSKEGGLPICPVKCKRVPCG